MMFATDGKRLAGWSAGDQINAPIPRTEILVMNVRLYQGPVSNNIIAAPLISPDCFARIMIVLKDCVVLETGVGRRDGQTSSSSE